MLVKPKLARRAERIPAGEGLSSIHQRLTSRGGQGDPAERLRCARTVLGEVLQERRCSLLRAIECVRDRACERTRRVPFEQEKNGVQRNCLFNVTEGQNLTPWV